MRHRHPIPPLHDCLEKSRFPFLELMEKGKAEAGSTERYLSWEEMRHHLPPDGMSPEEWWCALKLNRLPGRTEIPACDKCGKPFSYLHNALIQKQLHLIDKMACGTVYSDSRKMLSPSQGDFYLVSSLEEESIMSSMLEGASVTRADAKSMIRENRAPVGEHERMVLNNYRTMQHIKAWKDLPMTPDRVLAVHRFMTDGLLPADKSGRLRGGGDPVRVEDSVSGDVVHIPPPADGLPQRLDALCRFAMDDDSFIHPVIKAVILHFWLAYDHPFADGNGRTARALFYWMMLRSGYWIFEYVAISQEIYRKASSYYTAFMDTEADDGDLNYFICDQLRTIRRAIDRLYDYIRRKREERSRYRERLQSLGAFNHRQQALLGAMSENPGRGMTVEVYKNDHHVSAQTARNDLTALVSAGLLRSVKQGKGLLYLPLPDLARRLFSR